MIQKTEKLIIADSKWVSLFIHQLKDGIKQKTGKTWCYYKKDSDGNLYLLRGGIPFI